VEGSHVVDVVVIDTLRGCESLVVERRVISSPVAASGQGEELALSLDRD
jgi:hypothetical protein